MTNGSGSGAGNGNAGGEPAAGGSAECPWCGTRNPVTAPAVPAVPDGNGCLHFAEGTVMAVMAVAAGTYYADEWGRPWLTVVGALAGLLVFVGTIAVIRGDQRDRERAREAADRARGIAAEIAAGATRHCVGCGDEFSVGESAAS